MHVAPRHCPVCTQELAIRRLQCTSCDTTLEGSFVNSRSALMRLDEDDLAFVELFVRVRGNIREVEKALGVSYPTVRGMLDAINQRLQRRVDGPSTHGSPPAGDRGQRLAIIQRLEQGEITPDQAAELLSALGGKDETNLEGASI